MPDGSVTIEIKGDSSDIEKKVEGLSDSLESGLVGSTKNADQALNSTNEAAGKLASVGLKAVTAAAAAMASALVAGATAAVAAGSKYESAFAQVETIMDQNVVSATEMSDAILELSNSTGQSAAELSESVYNAISATGDTANAVSLVTDATRLATAGFADSSDALSVLTTITNAYGIATTEAAAISDSLIQTQNLGVTTVAQLSTSMGKAIATAAAYSIDLYNLEAAYVSLTKAGISTEESTTYVSSMFKELGDAGSDVAKIINEETGQSFGQLMQSGASLGDVLQILIDYVDGDTEALMNLWGSAEAGKAASAIASQGISEFNDNLYSLQNSAGATESAYETMTQTLSYQTDLLKTRVSNLGTVIYEKFSDTAVNAVSKIADAFGDLIESMESGDLADDLDNIAESFGNLIDSTADFISGSLPSIISGFSWILDHAGAVAAEIGVLAAGFTALKIAVTTAKIAESVPAFAAISGAALSAVGPILGIGTAVIALSVAFADMVEWMQEDATGLGEHKDALEDNRAQTERNSESVEELIQKYRELKDTISGNETDVSGQITQLNSLVAAYDGSASSAYAIQSAIESLNAAVPGLNASFDAQAGTLNKTTAEMQALNEQYAAQSAYDAAMQQKTATTQAYNTALADQKRDLEELNALQAEFEAWKGANPSAVAAGYEGSAAYAAWADAIGAAEANLASSTAEVNAAGHAMGEAMVDVQNTAVAYDEATDAVNGFAEAETEAATTGSNLSEEQLAVASSMAQIRAAARNAKGSASDLRNQYNELLKQYEALETEGMDYAAGVTEQALAELDLAATTAELSEALGTLGSISGLNLGEVASQLIATGQSASTFASSFNSSLGSVVNGYKTYQQESYISLQSSTEALQANVTAHANWQSNITTLWNEAVASGDAAQMAYVQSLYQMGDASSQIVEELQGNGEALAENAALYAEATQQAGQEAALGLAMEAGQVYDSATQVADSANQGLEDGASEAQNAGSQYDTDMATGMTNNISVVETAATSVANAAASAAGSVDFTSVGYYISAGIAAGIASGESMVTTAAVNVVKAAKSAADAEAQIGSPSKLFRDEVGYWISAGMAKGIEKGTPLVEKQSANVIEMARTATMPVVETVRDGISSGNITNIYNNSALAGIADRVRNVVVPLYLNGREFARATAEDMWSQLDYLT